MRHGKNYIEIWDTDDGEIVSRHWRILIANHAVLRRMCTFDKSIFDVQIVEKSVTV